MAKFGCITMILGVIGMILSVVCKIWMGEMLGISARSFASASALMLLLSIAAHQCAMCCFQKKI